MRHRVSVDRRGFLGVVGAAAAGVAAPGAMADSEVKPAQGEALKLGVASYSLRKFSLT